MKTVTIQIIDEEYDRLARLADVLNQNVEEFLCLEGVAFILEGIGSSAAENLAARIWDTIPEAKQAAAKADTIDESAYWWAILETPEGKFVLEPGEASRAAAESAGFIMRDCGLSADWKKSIGPTVTA
jgi:hypothetical protein